MKQHQQHRKGRGSRETRVSLASQRVEIRRNSDGSRTLTGTAIVYNSKSEDLGGGLYELIRPGAFDNSLRKNPNVLILAQHNMSQPIASVASGTAKVWSDSRGVHYTAKLPDVSWANDLVVLIESGIVSQNSFGFVVPPGGDDFSTQPDGSVLRTVNTAVLYELSIVTAPAYTTSDNSVSLRSAPAHIRAQIRAKRAADQKTKTVDGEVLTADDFIIVGDPSDPEAWHLPWKFSTEEKTKAHLRDALARFDQLKGLSDEVLKAAWKRLLKLCKQHGIDVSSEDQKAGRDRSQRGYFTSIDTSSDDDDDDDDDDDVDVGDPCDPNSIAYDPDNEDCEDDDEDRCSCRCAECRGDGGCGDCSNAYCEDEMCSASGCAIQQRALYQEMILRRLR